MVKNYIVIRITTMIFQIYFKNLNNFFLSIIDWIFYLFTIKIHQRLSNFWVYLLLSPKCWVYICLSKLLGAVRRNCVCEGVIVIIRMFCLKAPKGRRWNFVSNGVLKNFKNWIHQLFKFKEIKSHPRFLLGKVF